MTKTQLKKSLHQSAMSARNLKKDGLGVGGNYPRNAWGTNYIYDVARQLRQTADDIERYLVENGKVRVS